MLFTHAASNRLMVVLNPSVAVSLSYITTLRTISKRVTRSSYVGKKLMKLQPRSCEHVITAIMDTLGSFIANTKPFQALRRGNLAYEELIYGGIDGRIYCSIVVCFTYVF